MLGLTAAPEMAIAVASVRPYLPPYDFSVSPRYRVDRNAPAGQSVTCDAWFRASRLQLPACSGEIVNGTALRSCHARFFEDARLAVTFTTCSGSQSAT